MNVDQLKDSTFRLSIGTLVGIITVTVSLTTFYWKMATLEARDQKRYDRQEEHLQEIDKRLKQLESLKTCN